MLNNTNNYIGGEYNFYKKIEDELTLIIDVGAQDSFFTNTDCTVHYFEPDSKAFSRLTTNKKNHFFNNVGLGSKNETKILYNDLGSTYYRQVGHVNYDNCEEITIIKLDDYIEEKQIKQISLLKIDTEGMEYEILLGASNNLHICKYIVFEYAWDTADAANSSFTKIKNLLVDFDIFDMDANGNLIQLDEEKITKRVYPNCNNLVAINKKT